MKRAITNEMIEQILPIVLRISNNPPFEMTESILRDNYLKAQQKKSRDKASVPRSFESSISPAELCGKYRKYRNLQKYKNLKY